MTRWKRVEYERLVDRGCSSQAIVSELIDGLLLVSEPQSSPHYTAIRARRAGALARLRRGLGSFARRPRSRSTIPRSPSPTWRSCAAASATSRSRIRPIRCSSSRSRLEPRVRPRAQGEPLCARRAPRVLDRQSDRPRARGPARPGAEPSAPYGWRLCARRRAGPDATGSSRAALRPSRSLSSTCCRGAIALSVRRHEVEP
mgnify:CR=1 FL=1